MGSFGAPTKNLGSRSLPQLKLSGSGKGVAGKALSEQKRLRLEALRRAALREEDKLERAKRAAAQARRIATPLRKSASVPGEAAVTTLDPGLASQLMGSGSAPGSANFFDAPGSRQVGGVSRGAAGGTPYDAGASQKKSRKQSRAALAATPDLGSSLPVDWRVLAACEVVLDREDEEQRKNVTKEKVKDMHRELRTQLERNAARRAEERKKKQEWMRAVRLETEQIKAAEVAEKRALHEKRMRDREMFREQARLQRERAARDKALNAAEEKREIDAARKSLAEEEAKTKREKETSKAKQETLRLEILEERRVKKERQLAEWRETERIDREAERARVEEERRRREIAEKRDAQINKFAKMHERGAGKVAADAERCVEINHWFGASPPNFRNL